MKYLIKQKLWTSPNPFDVKNELGQTILEIKGSMIALGDKLSFHAPSGPEMAFVVEKLISFDPSYEIYRGGSLFAQVRNEKNFFKDEMSIDIPGPNDYSVQGLFGRYEYRFLRNGLEVASVSPRFFPAPEHYGIEIVPGEDLITLMATCLVIDMVVHGRSPETPNEMPPQQG